jgi:excisionase family DNA binding protein
MLILRYRYVGADMPILGEYVDVVEAASILKVHWETVKRLCREGRIPAQKVHNKWLIHKDDLDKFAEAYDSRRGKRRTGNPSVRLEES